MDRKNQALQIGVRFIKEFFGCLAAEPHNVHQMYSVESSYTDDSGTLMGTDQIAKHYRGLPSGAKFSLTDAKFQPSHRDSVLIIVKGVQLTRKEATKFSRTFVLAKNENENSYYIINDFLENRGKDEEETQASGRGANSNTTSGGNTSKAAVKSEPEPERESAEEKKPAAMSWAEKFKSSTASTPAAAPQRVIGGTSGTTTETEQQTKTKEKKEPPVEKSKKRSKSPTEMYQYAALFVNHLPTEMTEADIDKLFSKYGRIMGKTYKGTYCFIDFEDKSAVQAAVADKAVCTAFNIIFVLK